ncbi:hypothetical protein QX51_15210 [Terrisporobacter othiniensis]|uniref:Peptidase S74 domain-containing protein n=1 Tax=Terrisporobacter othiniensis TaxID=1577792 RepID=A0A0B3VU08_9FIRM|nr:hypothetical protein [Terrisporobacter othiniensis]KHS56119.1 hypothetical protein QX51_15210 [Terrisporobacter othiniensis]
MQNVSSSYLLEIKKPSRSFECKVTIRDNIYTNADIINITIEDVQPSDGFSIGSAVSKSLELTLSTNNTIYSNSIVKVEIGLNVGSKIEYVLMGYFNIDDIEKTDYSIKLTCFDNMMKFEKPYFSKLGKTASLKNIVNELSQITGVEFTGSLPSYNLNKLEGFTCREALGFISSLCAGNAYITRDGKFTINTLKTIDYSITDENYIDLKTEENVYRIGAVTCKVNEKELTKGTLSNSSMEVTFENPWVNDSILTDIYNKLKSIEYVGYSMKWQGDLSLDVGDIISLTDHKGVKRNIPILSQKFNYNGGLTSEIGAKGESKNKNEFNSTGNLSNKVNRVVTELLIVNEALINKADIEDLKAVNATIENLIAENVTITGKLTAIEGEFGTLKANVGVIDKLTVTHTAQINELEANKASITQLEAVSAKIGTVEAEVGKIQTLVNGNLSSENIQAGGITSDKLTIANGFITNAMIANLDVSKINAGDISTNKFRIKSDDGGIEIVGATQQFKDKNNKVRVQIGRDKNNNFTFSLFDETGTGVLIDHTGIKEGAIADDLIISDMIASDAVGEKQINYSSFITGFNKDTNTNTIKSTKIMLNNQNQTLDVAFNQLKTQADDTKSLTESHSTTIGVMQGQITTAINNTQIVKDGQTILLKDDYNRTVQTVNSMNSTIVSHTTKINEHTGKITGVETRVNTVERDLDGITARVSSTEKNVTTVTNTANAANSNATNALNIANSANSKIDGLEIGGRNIVKDTGTSKSIIGTGTTNRTGCTYHFTVPYLTDIKGKELIVVFDWKYEGENPSGTFYMQTGEPQYGLVTGTQTISPTNTKGTVKNIWKPAMERDTKSVYIRTDNMVGTFTISNLRVYFGTKDIGWTPAPEDVQTQIDTNKTEISSTKSKVSSIETNLSSITSRVSEVEKTQTTVDGKVTSLQTRMQSAEQKLTKEGLTTIISNHYTTSNDVNGIVTSKGYQTHSQVQQTVDKLQAKFTANGGYNKLYNSAFLTGDIRNWSNLGTCTRTVTSSTTSGFAKCLKIVADGASQGVYQIVDNLVVGKQYTLSALVKATSGKTGIQVYHDDKYLHSYTSPEEKYQVLSITFKATTTTASIRLGTLGSGTSGTYYYTGVLLTEGELVEPWSPHPSEVYDGITTIDKDGITVTSSNVKSKTTISANGFKIIKTDTNEEVFKVNSSGRLELYGIFRTRNGDRKSGYFGENQVTFYNWWSDTNESIAYFYGGKTSANKRSADVVGKDVFSLGVGEPGSGTKVLEGSSSTLNIYKNTNFNNYKLKEVNSINEDTIQSTFVERIVIRSSQVNSNHDSGNLNLNYWKGYNVTSSVEVKVCNGNNDGTRGKLTCQDFKAYGTKNACVQTSVGYVDINAYETADYYFGDIGETILDNDGYSYVYIDSIFTETANTSRKYQVFLSVYGEGIANVIERYPTHFIIKGTPNLEVGYEIKAKRKGYEDYRFEREENPFRIGESHGLDEEYIQERVNFDGKIEKSINEEITKDIQNKPLEEFIINYVERSIENKDLMEIIEEDLNYENIN